MSALQPGTPVRYADDFLRRLPLASRRSAFEAARGTMLGPSGPASVLVEWEAGAPFRVSSVRLADLARAEASAREEAGR